MKKYRWLICCAAFIAVLGVLTILYYNGILGQRLQLSKSDFKKLQHWQSDQQLAALVAFQQSCREILKRNPDQPFNQGLIDAGQVRDWQIICTQALKQTQANNQSARAFFESWFDPYNVKNHLNPNGKFTGYYLPMINGSLKPDQRFTVPVYGLPYDLVKVNLGMFAPALSGRTIVGSVKNNVLIPYPDRAEISQGKIDGRAPVLVWVDSEIDLFFAQIQGSAIVALPDGQRIMIGYNGANGRSYTAIGSILIARHEIDKKSMSMQKIRAWLKEHPDQAKELLNRNASYVFFRILPLQQPLGVQQVALTPERSLAVDTRYLPVGAPVWLETSLPPITSNQKSKSYQHLLIAQDTGSAIKGAIRGDIYFGSGETAEALAGHMNQRGQYWVLLPKKRHHSEGSKT